MKKAVTLFSIASVILVLTTSQVQAPKELTVKLSLQEWQNILGCLDQSNAPHLQVQAASQALISQLQKQVDTTSKK